MSFFEFLLKNLFRRKTRSALTMIGVAIAVGTMVALVSISSGFKRSSLESFKERGVDLVVLKAGVLDQLSSNLDERIGERIKQLPGVKEVYSGLLDFQNLPTPSGNQLYVLVQGWQPGTHVWQTVKILEGRTLAEEDHLDALLGENLAKKLQKGVGDKFTLLEKEFTVVGIYQTNNFYEDQAMVILLKDMQNLQYRKGKVTGFSVLLEHSDHPRETLDRVRGQIDKMEDEKGHSLGLEAKATEDFVKNSSHIQTSEALAWVLSVIAVVIGTIGVLNTMIMAVLERVREIGILRAVGWRKSRVVRMILGESLVLSLAGAVLGILVALVGTQLIKRVPAASSFIEGTIDLGVVVKGLLMALLVGLAGGVYPAYRASQLLPTEALRHE